MNAPANPVPASLSPTAKAFRRLLHSQTAVAGIAITSVLVVAGAFASVLAPYDYRSITFEAIHKPPFSPGHLLGTDELGRDVLSRLLFGASISLQMGLGATSVALVLGVGLGAISGYFGGWTDAVVQRLHEDLAEQMPAGAAPPVSPADLATWLADRVWDFAQAHRVHIRVLLRNVLDSGGHEAVIMDRWSGDLLARADALIGLFRPDWSSVHRRLFVMSVMHAVARFAVEDPDQLAAMAARPIDLDSDIRAFLADHLRLNLRLP